MEQIKKIFGVMMLGLAIWMISRILPGVATMSLWSALLIISAVAFGALNLHEEKRLSPALHGISVLALVYAVLLLTGAASGHENLFNPLSNAYSAEVSDAPRPASSLFTYVQTLPALEKKLASAANDRKPVMIEFFATWCPSCKKVDRDVLSNETIRQQMKKFATIRVDVSERNPALALIMEKYAVYGVPTLVFIDKNGHEIGAEKMGDDITRGNLMSMLKNLST